MIDNWQSSHISFVQVGNQSMVKRNLVVFLKPTIIKNAADMQTISTEKYNYLKAEQMLLEKRGKPVVDLSLIETFLDEQ